MPTTITVRRPDELLSYVPYRLGYRPRESVVVVSLRPPRRRVGLVVRVDLDDLTDERGGRGLVRTICRHLERDDAEALVLVVYSDRADADVADAVDLLEDELGAAAPVVDRWLVASSGYRNLDCRDASCCPPGGRPLADLDASAVAAELVYSGATLASSREHAYQLPPTTIDGRRAARRAGRRWLAKRESVATATWRREGLRTWRAAVRAAEEGLRDGRGVDLAPPVAGRLAAALGDRDVRDAVLVSLIGPDAALADRTLVTGSAADAELAADVADALAAVIDPDVARAPDLNALRPARLVLEHVAACARPLEAAAALTLLALLAWWAGDGGLAHARLSAALEADPSHRLAQILTPAVRGGMAPGWVRTQRVASGSV
jgi:hypothetical protein